LDAASYKFDESYHFDVHQNIEINLKGPSGDAGGRRENPWED
jgi:hypothetical protein